MPGTANDIAIITSGDRTRYILMAVFTKAATTAELDGRERAIAEIARAICDDFWRQPR
jgi:beta-lactamase class A